MTAHRANFNLIARAYRWLEYLSFGPLLERCRYTQLDRLGDPRRALVLGDGDGRFLARLLERYPLLTADSVDLSSAMTGLAQRRVKDHTARVQFYLADVRNFTLPTGAPYDLVVANFFLDCLRDAEILSLFERLALRVAPRALCVIAEFAIPERQPFGFAARLLVRSLYFAFHLLTRLSVHTLPDYPSILRSLGMQREDSVALLGGILQSELWRFEGWAGNEPLQGRLP